MAKGLLSIKWIWHLFRWFIYSAVGLSLFLIDPFGVGGVAEEYSEDLADLVVFGPAYGSGSQDDVTVVIINDETLEALNLTWPLSLATHANFLEAICFYKPSVVFVDIVFQDLRPDAGVERFLDVVSNFDKCETEDEETTPLYFASFGAKGALRGDIEGKVVKVPLPALDDRRRAATYPLITDGLLTPASVLYEAMRSKKLATLADVNVPVQVLWGTEPHPVNHWMDCKSGRKTVSELWNLLLFGVDDAQQTCPHSGHIPAHYFMRTAPDVDLKTLIRGNAVLVGASFAGARDTVFTPTHGAVPGVYFHAAALDNLLSTDGEYRRSTMSIWDTTIEKQHLDIALLLALITALVFYLPYEDKSRNVEMKVGPVRFLKSRLTSIVFMGTALGLLVAVQTGLAMVLNLSVGNWLGLMGLFAALKYLASFRPAGKIRASFRWLFGMDEEAKKQET